MDKQKLIRQLFIGKVADLIGLNKTTELLKEANNEFSMHDNSTQRDLLIDFAHFFNETANTSEDCITEEDIDSFLARVIID
jgi:hypothetical protein